MSIYQSTKVSPYVYWLTHKVTGQFYIGYREANKIPSDQDLPIYKSSSDTIDELGFENFNFQILAEFFDGDSAYDFENRTIEINFRNPLCLNKHYTKDGQNKFKHIIPHTSESKMKMSIATENSSIETRYKMGSSNRGKTRHPNLTKKLNEVLTGHIKTEETRTKISKSLSGENHFNAKIWKIIDEKGILKEINSLTSICNKITMINRSTLIRKSLKDEFHKGYKIIEMHKTE